MTASKELISLSSAAAHILTKNKQTVAVAESCTGGMLSEVFTSISGSSAYFLGGIVAYDNSVKEGVLGVAQEVLEQHGAVSKQTALAMAKEARLKVQADIGIGVTGLAGPTGGTAEKPVGLVYVALDSANGSACREFHFDGDRNEIREQTCVKALRMLLEELVL